MKCRIRKKKKLSWRGGEIRFSAWSSLFFFLLLSLRSVGFERTANRQATWLMSCFDCDPRYILVTVSRQHEVQCGNAKHEKQFYSSAVVNSFLIRFFFFFFLPLCSLVSFHPTQPRLPIKQPNYASTEDTFHTFCARYLIRSNKVDGNALHLHLVRKVRKVLFRNLFANGWKCCLPSLAYLPTLSTLFQTLHHTHTHTESWSSGCSNDDLAIVYSSCQSIVYCGSARLPSPPPPPPSPPHAAHTLASTPQMASQFQPASPTSA